MNILQVWEIHLGDMEISDKDKCNTTQFKVVANNINEAIDIAREAAAHSENEITRNRARSPVLGAILFGPVFAK